MVRIFKPLAMAAIALAGMQVEAKDKKFHLGATEVKINGKSGKFKVYRKDAGEEEPNKIEIEMDSLTEVDASGKEVGKKGKVKHTIKSFASQDFVFSEPATVTMDYPCVNTYMVDKTLTVFDRNETITNSTTNVSRVVTHMKDVVVKVPEERDEICTGAEATKLQFNSTISDGVGNLAVDTFIINKAGKTGPDGDDLWMVAPGDMKFNFEFLDWKFCGSSQSDGKGECKDKNKDEVGEFIDLEVKIKGKKEKPEKKPKKDVNTTTTEGRKGKGKKEDYDLGGGIDLKLTNLITIDGEAIQMPEGYPKMEMKGSKQIFTFRIPKFAKNAVYDPLTTTGEQVVPPPPADMSAEGEEKAIKIMGQSGKFVIYSKSLGMSDPNRVTVTFDALREVNAAGETVGKTGQTKHSINTFAAQEFTIAQPENVVMPNSNNTVNAQKINFISKVSSIGHLFVDTYLIKNKGTCGPEGESWPVGAGDVKFNIGMSGWQFCTASTCSDGVGDAVELDITVQGNSTMAKALTSGKEFDLGGGSKLTLTDKITVDGQQVFMAQGYPKMTSKGTATIFTFKFPKFAVSALYDPLIGSMPEEEDNTGTVTSSAMLKVLSMPLMVLMAAASKVF